MSSNPLLKSSRSYKIYVKLPSKNIYYKSDSIETSPNGEIGVKAMTATDDFLLKNPDALLNGDAIISLMKSCVPSVKKVEDLVLPDVSALLLAVRYSSSGDNMKFNHKCDNCEHESEETVSIRHLLDMTTFVEDETKIEYDADENEMFHIYLQPTPYVVSANSGLMSYERARVQQMLENNEIDDDKKRKLLSDIFDKMAKYQLKIVSSSINQISILNKSSNETENTVIDQNYIHEFVQQMPKSLVDEINEKVRKLNMVGVPKTLNHVCDNCGKEGELEVDVNPTNFFEENS